MFLMLAGMCANQICKRRTVLLLVVLTLITISNGAGQKASAKLISRVDHLVYATPDLNRGVEEIEKLLGIRATAGANTRGAGPEMP